MPKSKRPAKVRMDIILPPTGIQFVETFRHSNSIYRTKLTDALAAESVIAINKDDTYLQNAFRTAAKKINIGLLFAVQGDTLFIKPRQLDGEMKRLMLLLRNPRTINELRTHKLQLNLEQALNNMSNDDVAHIVREKWILTEKGEALLKKTAA